MAKVFCKMCSQERAIYLKYKKRLHLCEREIVWKPIVAEYRETCDECSTSLFNYHFICKICGFSVCFECCEERCITKPTSNEQDEYVCLFCKEQRLSPLTLAQIIPDGLLLKLSNEMHILQQLWNIPYECKCPLSTVSSLPPKFDSELYIHEQDNVEYMCNKKLIRLMNPTNRNNVKVFQEEWKRGHPLIVSNIVNKSSLWRPSTFSKIKGKEKCSLFNCGNGCVIKDKCSKEFWDGFNYVNKRLRDERNKPMILKMKDWPENETFSQMLPLHYDDFVGSLPLGDYTKFDGQLNLVTRLPSSFIPPDLGPKMYSAYSSNLDEKMGTTNLHLDISDAINVMAYVSI